MTLLCTVPASADLMWKWNYDCSLFKTQTKCIGGSGQFTTTDHQGSGGDQYYLVTEMSGTVEGNVVTALLPPGSFGMSNDNKLDYPSGDVFDNTAGKITGTGFLANNNPSIKENSYVLFSNYIDFIVGSYIQISGPNKLALLSVDFNSKEISGSNQPVAVSEPQDLSLVLSTPLFLGTLVTRGFAQGIRSRQKRSCARKG